MKKKRLFAGLLASVMMVTLALPTSAASAKSISIQGKSTVTVGGVIELDSKISPRGAKVSDRKILWSSSKSSVAKVLKSRDDDTKVKGVKAGTATITVKIEGTSIKSSKKITVKKAASTASTTKAEKRLTKLKKKAKTIKTNIGKVTLASTVEQRRIQYKTYENKLDAIDRKLDRMDDNWESKMHAGKISRSSYRALERKIEAVEDYLETVEDYLNQKFNYEFDD